MNHQPLSGGTVNDVIRHGDLVCKSGGPWVPAVQAVLAHLERVGFLYTPRPRGATPDGREVMTYLHGEPMLRPWRQPLLGDDGLVQLTTMLRRLHEMTHPLTFPADTIWRSGKAPKTRDQIIRHGDLGPWNTMWQGHVLTGLVDWDLAEPGLPLTDLAQLAYYAVPLRAGDHWRHAGFASQPDIVHRLQVIAATYGDVDPDHILVELRSLLDGESTRISQLGEHGVYPWTTWYESGEHYVFQADKRWLEMTFSLS